VAAVDYLLNLDGIAGESKDARHKGAIEIDSFSWGETQSVAQGGGGGGAGKVAMQDIHFTTPVSKASPQLFLACANGKHIKQAVLTARKAGKDQQDFLVFTFSDVLVSSYQVGGAESGADVPVDRVSLRFARIEYEYRGQKADGSLDTPAKAGWDLKQNKQV
jgi:type VI secretion system secreted protein Hcp